MYITKLDFRLVAAANTHAAGGEIGIEHIDAAYSDIVDPHGHQAVQNVITTALKENRFFEIVTYVMIFFLFVLGSFLLVVGLVTGSDPTTRITGVVGGSIAQILILPALRYAVSVRRHNVSIRLLGAILARDNSPKAYSGTVNELMKKLLDGGT